MQKQINSPLNNKIMYITYKNYKLQVLDYSFNLIEEYEARKIGDGTKENPTGVFYKAQNILANGCSLEFCIKRIIHLEMKSKTEKSLYRNFLKNIVLWLKNWKIT